MRLVCLFCITIWGIFFRVTAQTESLEVEFVPHWQGRVLDFGLSYDPSISPGFHIETLKFYVSAVELWRKGKKVYSEEKSYHLIEASTPEKRSFRLDLPADLIFDELQFCLGIDSLTNVQGAQGGDLDPRYGMYWTWQSGYIHFKLEGTAAECPTPKHRFTYHLGGYQAPHAAYTTLALDVLPQAEISIGFDLGQVFQSIDLPSTYRIMRPGPQAAEMIRDLSLSFSVLP